MMRTAVASVPAMARKTSPGFAVSPSACSNPKAEEVWRRKCDDSRVTCVWYRRAIGRICEIGKSDKGKRQPKLQSMRREDTGSSSYVLPSHARSLVQIARLNFRCQQAYFAPQTLKMVTVQKKNGHDRDHGSET